MGWTPRTISKEELLTTYRYKPVYCCGNCQRSIPVDRYGPCGVEEMRDCVEVSDGYVDRYFVCDLYGGGD